MTNFVKFKEIKTMEKKEKTNGERKSPSLSESIFYKLPFFFPVHSRRFPGGVVHAIDIVFVLQVAAVRCGRHGRAVQVDISLTPR